jgi:hypothetical protein
MAKTFKTFKTNPLFCLTYQGLTWQALGQRGKQDGGQVLNTCLPIGCMQPIAFCQPAQGVAASFFTGAISSKKLAFWLLLCYAIGRWVDIGSAARELPASRL